MISTARLKEDIETLRNISDPCSGGVTRIGFTPAYRCGVEYIKKRMLEIGLDVFEDEIGNVHGLLRGSETEAPRILTGSHLDTVRNAGAFDGIAGVVCALEAARQLKEQHITLNHSLEIIGFIEEEGTSFGQVLLGSRFISGELTAADLGRFTGQDGTTLQETLPIYMQGITTVPVRRNKEKILAFLEVHDEQGPVLEETGTHIGIVQRIVAISQLTVTVTGFAGHAGTVPMDMRQDAGLAACSLIQSMSGFVLHRHCREATLTVGKIGLLPNSSNCIPDQCAFTVDVRSGEKTIVDGIIAEINDLAAAIEKEFHVSVEVRIDSFKDAVGMDACLRQIISESCEKLGLSSRPINSGAGHDAMVMAGICPTAMIFIPCEKGITHHPLEKVEWPDMANGTAVLLQTILALDSRVEQF